MDEQSEQGTPRSWTVIIGTMALCLATLALVLAVVNMSQDHATKAWAKTNAQTVAAEKFGELAKSVASMGASIANAQRRLGEAEKSIEKLFTPATPAEAAKAKGDEEKPAESQAVAPTAPAPTADKAAQDRAARIAELRKARGK
ncbi:hypothetical protein HY504_00565 [Candidatus Wolfebacteria bacterium]|nr:hypothetical protein [Candidatus Wolfebacteria bacterium]